MLFINRLGQGNSKKSSNFWYKAELRGKDRARERVGKREMETEKQGQGRQRGRGKRSSEARMGGFGEGGTN